MESRVSFSLDESVEIVLESGAIKAISTTWQGLLGAFSTALFSRRLLCWIVS